MSRKRLLKSQREILLQWIAEGLLTDEINQRAAKCADPFKVSRQQVDYYRKKCDQDIKELQAQAKFQALNTGLARKEERVEVLHALADKMKADLLELDKVWVTVTKAIGTGKSQQIIDETYFNRSEIDALRGVLDDIAKEIGDRSIKQDINTNDDGEYRITFVSEQTKERDEA